MPTPQEKAMAAALEARATAAATAAATRAQYDVAAATEAPPPVAAAEPQVPAVPEGYVQVGSTQYRTLGGLTADPAWANASHAVRQTLYEQWKKQHFTPLMKLLGDKKSGDPAAAKRDTQLLANWERVNMAAPDKKDSWADNDLLDIPLAALANSTAGVLRVAGDLTGSAGTASAGLGLQQWAKKYEDSRLSETTKQKVLQEGESATGRLYAAMLDDPVWAQKNLSALNKLAAPYGHDITKIPVTDPQLQALTQQYDRDVGLGVWDATKGAVADIWEQPLNKLSQTVGSMVPIIAGTAAAAAGGVGATGAALVGVGLNAVMSAGEASGDYDKVMALSHEQLMASSPEYKARLAAIPATDKRSGAQRQVDVQDALAQDAQAGGAAGRAAVAAVTGWVGRKVGLDSVVSGQAARLGKRQGAKQVSGTLLEEGVEEAGIASAGNAAVRTVDTQQRLGQGVAAAGVQGAVLGAGMGGVAGAASALGARGGRATAPAPVAAPPASLAGDLAALNAPAVAQEQAAQSLALSEMPGMLPSAGLPSTAELPGAAAPQAAAPELLATPAPTADAPAAATPTSEMLPTEAAAAAADATPVLAPDAVAAPLTVPEAEPSADSGANVLLAEAQQAARTAEIVPQIADNLQQEQDAADAVRSTTLDLGLGEVHTPLAAQPDAIQGDAVVAPPAGWAPATLIEADEHIAASPTATSITALFPETTNEQQRTGQDSGDGAAGGADAAADAGGTGNGAAGAGRETPAEPEGSTGAVAGAQPAGPAGAERGDAERGTGDENQDGGRTEPAPSSAVAADGPAPSPVRQGGETAGNPSPTAGGKRVGRSRTPTGGAANGAAKPDVDGQAQPGNKGSKPARRLGTARTEAVGTPTPAPAPVPAPAATPAAPATLAEKAKPRGGSAKAKGADSRAVNARVLDAENAVEDAKALPNLTDTQRGARDTALAAARAELKAAAAARAAFERGPAAAPTPATVPTPAPDPASRVKFTPDVTPDVRGVVTGWAKLLGLDDLTITVGSTTAAKMPMAADGAIDHRADGTKVIMFKRQLSERKTLETLAHEMGHALQRHRFEVAPPATQQAIRDAHAAWLETHRDSTDAQLVKALRPYGNGRAGVNVKELTNVQRDYAKSFNEWFADNVAKWATSSEVPRGVVEKFFSDLGQKLREFFTNAPEMHKPDVTLAAWLDTLGTKGVGEMAVQSGTELSQNLEGEAARVAQQTAEDSRIPAPIGAALEWATLKLQANDRARTADEYMAQATGTAMPKRSRFVGHNVGGRILDTFVDTLVKAEVAFVDDARVAEERAKVILDQTGATGALLTRYRAAMTSAVAALKESSDAIVLEARLYKNKADAYFRQHAGVSEAVERAIAETRPEGADIDAWRARANLYAQALHIRDRHVAKADSLQRAINAASAAVQLEERLRAGGAAGASLYQSMRDEASKLETALGQAFDSPKLAARTAAVVALHAQAVQTAQSVAATLANITDPAVKTPLRRLLAEHQRVLDKTAKPSNALHAISDLTATASALRDLGAKPEILASKLAAAEQAQASYEAANTGTPRRQTNQRGEAVDVFDYPLPGGVQMKSALAVIAAAKDQQAGLDAVQRTLVEGFRTLNTLAVQAGKASQADIDELQQLFPNYVSLAGDSQREVTDTFASKRRAFIDSSDGATHANQAAMPDENLGHKLKALATQVGRADLDRMLVQHARLNRTGGPALEVNGVVGADRLELPQSSIVRLASDYGAQQDRPDDLHTRRIEMPDGTGDVSVETIAIDNPGVADGLFKTPTLESELGRKAAQVTRTYGWLVTRFTAAFAPITMVRDVGERVFNVVGLQGRELTPAQVNKVRGHMLRLLKDKQTMLDVKNFAFMGRDTFVSTYPDSPLARLSKAGGLTTLTDYKKNEAELDAAVLRKDSMPAKAWDKLANAVDVYNTLFETLVPLATFDALQTVAGMDDRKAAGVTARMFDLRARGTATPHMSALYSFFAPTAYGGAQMWKTLTSAESGRRAQKELLGAMAAASMLYMVLRGLDDEDEQGNPMLDSQTEALAEGSIPIPLGDGTYFKVPMAFGSVRLAWIAGVRGVRVVAGVDSPWAGVAAVATEMVKSVLPTGVSQESATEDPARFLAKTFTPSLVKTVTNLATNTNAFGTPLNYGLRNGEYASEQGQYTTPEVYSDMAGALRTSSGGMLDTTPESMRELLGGVLIGPAASLLTLMAAGDKEAKGLAENAMKDGLTGAMVQAVGGGRLVSVQSDAARDAYQVRHLSEKALALVREVNHRVPKESGAKEDKEAKLARAEDAGMDDDQIALLDAYYEWESASQGGSRKMSVLRKAETRDLDALKEAVAERQDLMRTFIEAGAGL